MSSITRRGVVVVDGVDVSSLRLQPEPPTTRTIDFFARIDDGIAVPIHWARSRGMTLRDERRDGAPAPRLTRFVGTLRDDLRQPEAVRAVLESFETHDGGAMLSSPPGFGKTTMALFLASTLRKKTLVVVHLAMLMDQWIDRISTFLPDAVVTTIRGQDCDVSGDVVIAMVQTLVSRSHPPTTFERFHLVIVDEAHHWAAERFSATMFGCGLFAPCTLALTATPRRRDGLERAVEWMIGPLAFYHERAAQHDTVVKIRTWRCEAFDAPMPLNRRGDVDFNAVVATLVHDAERTAWIASLVATEIDPERDVLVLSHRRAHCEALCRALLDLEIDAHTYLGGDKAVPTSRVIVATYRLVAEAFDCPRLTALVLATPASDVVQACGRVMRGAARAGSVVVDVVDAWGMCRAQSYKRRAWYKASGFSIV